MWAALKSGVRYIVTPTVAKHRLFVWLDGAICPDQPSLLQNSLRARNLPWFWFAGARGSGWCWPEAGDAEDLIGGERDDAEHEMAFDLGCAAHA